MRMWKFNYELTEQLPQAPQGQALMSKIRAGQAVAAAPPSPGAWAPLVLEPARGLGRASRLFTATRKRSGQTAFCKGHGA